MFNQISTEGMNLSEISVTGYKDGMFARLFDAPAVELSTMNKSGKTTATYSWYDKFEGDPMLGEGNWIGGYWKNNANGKVIVAKGQVKDSATEEEEIALNPGDGLWLHIPLMSTYEDSIMTKTL